VQSDTPKKTIAAAKALLASKDADAAAKLLLEEGFIKRSQPEIQAAYLDLIPPGKTLREMLSSVYRGLDDPKVAVRRKVSMQLARELSRTAVRDNVRWMRDPRAVDPLIDAMEDSDSVVRERVLGALMRLVNRFFPDQRTAPIFIRYLNDEKQSNRFNAISGIGCLRQESLLEHLVRPLAEGTDEDRAQVAAQLWGLSFETWYHMHQLPIEWSEPGRQFWRKKMLEALSDPAPKVREHATRALEKLGDVQSVAALKSAREKEENADVRFYMEQTLAALSARE
jgi:hypothetical protein